MTTLQVTLTILTIATCTLITRAAPFIIFTKNKKTPEFINYLGSVLPFSIIGMLIVYCFKDTSFVSGNFGIPEILALSFVAIMHKWKHNILISIGGGTILYMIMIQLVFVQ